MPKVAKELTAIEVARIISEGMHAVGGVAGLMLQVSKSSYRSWILRARIGSKRRDIGLGGYPEIGLAKARERARDKKDLISKGIDPVGNTKTSFLEMVPTLPQGSDNISIDLDSLSFLLDTNNVNLIGEISVEQARYEAVISAINDRSVVHLKEAQPALETSKIKNGGRHTLNEIEKALGVRLFCTLQKSTEQVITHVDKTILSLKLIADKLNGALKEQFSKEKIIFLSILEDRENNSQHT